MARRTEDEFQRIVRALDIRAKMRPYKDDPDPEVGQPQADPTPGTATPAPAPVPQPAEKPQG
ncbi:hypothetical protein ACQEU5_09095 [Marinactinospora thermotolerans]|uniref:hypothetical protein n=1 Tax=Marinactinospora thermotolerans TaxID=531310 RepID=UPI003D90540F